MTKFKKIEGYPNYMVCSDGYVVNTDTGIVLKGAAHFKTGYVKVCIYSPEHKPKTVSLHRLVAQAFCDRTADKTEVNHIDGNKLNNCAENLEWVTRDENLLHAYNTGLMPNKTASKTVIATNIETGEQIEFPSIYSASKALNISKGNICMCCQGNRPYAGGFYWEYKEE
jgi:hypothetical protein